jgi:hypothetical protein
VLFFFTTLLSLCLLVPILLLSLLSPPLKRIHNPLLLLPLLLTLFTGLLTLLSSFLVRRARTKESRRVVRMVTDGVGQGHAVGDEVVARALVGMDKRKWYHKVLSFLGGVVGFIAGLASLLLVLVSHILGRVHCADRSPATLDQHVSRGVRFRHTSSIGLLPPGDDQAYELFNIVQYPHRLCAAPRIFKQSPFAVYIRRSPKLLIELFKTTNGALRAPFGCAGFFELVERSIATVRRIRAPAWQVAVRPASAGSRRYRLRVG